jgi:prepilin-type processing-associated H-X9-DG protein
MQSHDAVKVAVEEKGPKDIAAALNVSLSLVYKWCEGKTANPLDRVDELVKATGSTAPLSWLCTRANGTFLPRPPATPADDARLVDDTRRMLKEFSDVLSAMTAAFLDGHVSQDEATLIRREWEELMPIAEGLVRACEARAEADARRR